MSSPEESSSANVVIDGDTNPSEQPTIHLDNSEEPSTSDSIATTSATDLPVQVPLGEEPEVTDAVSTTPLPDEKDATPVETSTVASPTAAVDNSAPSDPNTTTTATSTTAPTTTTSRPPPGGTTPMSMGTTDNSNLGAQILKNRFLSLRDRANQNAQTLWAKNSPALSENAKAVQERANQFWKTASATPSVLPVVSGFRIPQPTSPSRPKGVVPGSMTSIATASGGRATTIPTTTAVATTTSTTSSVNSPTPQSSTIPPWSTNPSPSVSTTTSHPVVSTLGKANEVQPRELSLDGDGQNEVAPTATTTTEPKIPSEAVTNNVGNDKMPSVEIDDDTSSVGGTSDVAALLSTGRALTRASLMASVAFESSVATFRGRYNSAAGAAAGGGGVTTSSHASSTGGPGTTDDETTITDTRPLPDSQLDIILKSRVGQHMQEILDKLEPHEFAMLLGRGMLGVNLKQCFLKNHGVFIDFMVPGGQAENSGVIRTGDLPVRLGDLDLQKGTILDIPNQISQAKRPVVLALATGTSVSLERMNYLDVAVAMMHRARDYYTKRGTLSNLPSASSPSRGGATDHNSSVATGPGDAADIKSVSDFTVPRADTIDSFLTPPAPNLDIRRDFQEEVPLRNLSNFLVDGLAQVHDLDPNFREAARNAFLTCALDGRRLLFVSRFFNSGDQGRTHSDPKITPSAQLMLFLELTTFLDLYHVTPTSKQRQMANKIAFKFFLPTMVGNKLQLPLFDFHHIVPDASLRHLELVLNAKTDSIPRDLFLDFSKAIVDSLAGAPFISFLTSSECSRMRAYLRNTAPYINLPLHELMDAMIGKTNDAAAKNCFAYLLLFLICHVEKEPAGEYNFSPEPETKMRLVGAPNDICCAIFLRRTFIPTLETIKTKLNSSSSDKAWDNSVIERAVNLIERFWDNFIVGAGEPSSKRDAVESSLKTLRVELERVAEELLKAGEGSIPSSRAAGDIISESKLTEIASDVAEEMVFNYAANVNSKFREHKFHEWMCNELSKLRAKDPTWSCKHEVPTLPQGCVKRLLRKADLPDGVSPHKPHREEAQDSQSENTYPNAEFGVVFGSTVGSELASEMQIPGIESTDIRRYACLPIALNKDRDMTASEFSVDEVIPPTLEGYAIVPSQKPKPFLRLSGDSFVSKDGWEVSLVSFSIPNAESSGASSALYGVSLFLQCKPDLASVVHERVDSFVCEKGSSSEGFISPIKVTTVESTDSESPAGELGHKGLVKNVSVAEPLPNFNDRLKASSWVSRVLGEEYRDSSYPLSIGLALVSRKNVVLAMRDTLSRLLVDYSQDRSGGATSSLGYCGSLVDVLGNFANRDVENISLRCILEPYLRAASAPWIERPVPTQSVIFEDRALHQISDCLPPTPLALMFITALLEQKIIVSSSRRSILLSATVALGTLLDPLKWSHLMVPLVPATLAGDLVQYPAPYILGIPSEESSNEGLIGNLPRDVTLVDLDVGRVILAPDFGRDNEMVRKSVNPAATVSALRSQVLYLAQALGGIFGNRMKPQSWRCDGVVEQQGMTSTQPPTTDIEGLKQVTKSFVAELLEGVSSCSYWIEEATQTYGVAGEPTVLFDEDKFFAIKDSRATVGFKPLFPKASQGELALNVNDFDLILESFLRCQSMSTYISSRPKKDMIFY